MTTQIRPLNDDDLEGATNVIITVAHGLFAPDVDFETFRDVFINFEGELADIGTHDTMYVAPDGLFLVAVDNDQIVGTGAIRRVDEKTAELKRMWLLEDYQGQGIGYALIQQLLAFARDHDYEKVVLSTSQLQTRAIAFYERVGFQQILRPSDGPVHGEGFEVHMQMTL